MESIVGWHSCNLRYVGFVVLDTKANWSLTSRNCDLRQLGSWISSWASTNWRRNFQISGSSLPWRKATFNFPDHRAGPSMALSFLLVRWDDRYRDDVRYGNIQSISFCEYIPFNAHATGVNARYLICGYGLGSIQPSRAFQSPVVSVKHQPPSEVRTMLRVSSPLPGAARPGVWTSRNSCLNGR